MKEISAFDVIGPIMVGPSSSHTAGALRIALLVDRIANADIKKVECILYGSFAATYEGHGTDRAIMGGILGFETFDPRIKHSLEIAKERGIDFSFTPDFVTETDHPNTVFIRAETVTGQKIAVTGESIGGGAMQITRINGIKVNFTGEYTTLIIEQQDIPGIVAEITTLMGEENINIAFMRLFRKEKGGRAFMIIETDTNVDDSILKAVLKVQGVDDVSIVRVGE